MSYKVIECNRIYARAIPTAISSTHVHPHFSDHPQRQCDTSIFQGTLHNPMKNKRCEACDTTRGGSDATRCGVWWCRNSSY